MKLYAEKSLARTRHLVADLGVIAWVAFWIWAAKRLYELILRLSGPGQKAEAAAKEMKAFADAAPDKQPDAE